MQSDDDIEKSDDTSLEIPEEWDRDELAESKSKGIASRKKGYTGLGMFIAWVSFIIIWLFFMASDYEIFQNLTLGLASLILFGGLTGMFYGPRDWRTNVSILTGVSWVAFLLLWFPWFSTFYSGYHNVAILIMSFLALITVIGLTWVTKAPGGVKSQMTRIEGGLTALFFGWLIFLVFWLWYFAGYHTRHFNFTIGFLSALVVYTIIVGIAPRSDNIEIGPGKGGAVLGFIWLLSMVLWFYFAAPAFDDYQNIAIILLSVILVAAVGFGVYRRRYHQALDAAFE